MLKSITSNSHEADPIGDRLKAVLYVETFLAVASISCRFGTARPYKPMSILSYRVEPTRNHSTARRSSAQLGAARHGTARHGTARHGTARHGTAGHKHNLKSYLFFDGKIR